MADKFSSQSPGSRPFSRRQFLRSAGGISFLALIPAGRGLFAAGPALKPVPMPVFTAIPYVQPGPSDGKGESMRLAWQTVQSPAGFEVRYGADKYFESTAAVNRRERIGKGENPAVYNYDAVLSGLEAGREYLYRVRCNGETLAEGYFTTRQPRGRAVRFAAFGDNSYGDISDRAIAFQAYEAHPDFVMNTGDNVYEGGLDSEYARYFFPVYNADASGPRIGAPLLRSIPFYSVIANHDVHSKNAKQEPVADFDASPDSLAWYTNFYFPLNGPDPAHPTSIAGAEDKIAPFKAAAGDRFPRMANYSFDYGDAHFLCLDSNLYIDPVDPGLQAWIQNDLAATDAPWKFVVYHHPAFNVGNEHYQEQHMRMLSPLFEKFGVDVVFHGHEHGYQRTMPLRFKPADVSKASMLNQKDRRVPGGFVVDHEFDGEKVTKPAGIIYITTGAGGKTLYDPGFTGDPAKWLHADDNDVAYIDTFISDRHSLTIADLDEHSLRLRQVDEYGQVVDRLRITKT